MTSIFLLREVNIGGTAAELDRLTNIVPVIAVGAAYVVLGERFTVGQALAAVVVLAGVVLVNRAAEAPRRGD